MRSKKFRAVGSERKRLLEISFSIAVTIIQRAYEFDTAITILFEVIDDTRRNSPLAAKLDFDSLAN